MKHDKLTIFKRATNDERRTATSAPSHCYGGQSLIEYAVMVGAVILAVVAVANISYRAFVGQAQSIERNELVF